MMQVDPTPQDTHVNGRVDARANSTAASENVVRKRIIRSIYAVSYGVYTPEYEVLPFFSIRSSNSTAAASVRSDFSELLYCCTAGCMPDVGVVDCQLRCFSAACGFEVNLGILCVAWLSGVIFQHVDRVDTSYTGVYDTSVS